MARFVLTTLRFTEPHIGLAVLFGYFMILALVGDETKILDEKTRLFQMNKILDGAGMTEYVYEDWVDATLTLLGELVAALKTGNAMETIEKAFNDEETSLMLVQHLRVRLTSNAPGN